MKDEQIVLNTTQEEIIRRVRGGECVLYGCSWNGKKFRSEGIDKSSPEQTTVVTASTGCAAVHIAGQTLHGWAGVGVEIKPLKDIGNRFFIFKK